MNLSWKRINPHGINHAGVNRDSTTQKWEPLNTTLAGGFYCSLRYRLEQSKLSYHAQGDNIDGLTIAVVVCMLVATHGDKHAEVIGPKIPPSGCSNRTHVSGDERDGVFGLAVVGGVFPLDRNQRPLLGGRDDVHAGGWGGSVPFAVAASAAWKAPMPLMA